MVSAVSHIRARHNTRGAISIEPHGSGWQARDARRTWSQPELGGAGLSLKAVLLILEECGALAAPEPTGARAWLLVILPACRRPMPINCAMMSSRAR